MDEYFKKFEQALVDEEWDLAEYELDKLDEILVELRLKKAPLQPLQDALRDAHIRLTNATRSLPNDY